MKRLEFVDSLRGLAALYVLVFHLKVMPSLETGLPAWADAVIMGGGTGVTLFFVISAFCLCLTMPEGDLGGGAIRDFYLRRLFRIAPLFYVVVAATLARNAMVRGTFPTPAELLGNLGFIFNLVPAWQDSLVFAGWTIGVEMIFYVLFPALFVTVRTVPLKLLAVLVSGGAFQLLYFALVDADVSFNKDRFFSLTVLHWLPTFVLGMIAFDLVRRLKPGRATTLAGAGCLLASAGLYTAHLGGILPVISFLPDIWVSLSFVLLLLGLAALPLRLFVNRAAVFLGTISYSVYLLHGPVILLINRPVYPRIMGLGLPQPVAFGLCLAVTLAVTIVAAVLTYRFVERPGIALGRRVIAARRRADGAGTVLAARAGRSRST